MSSNANVTNLGWSPTSTWSTISSVSGSMRATTPSSSHTTQTDPSATATPSGAAQTSMPAMVSFDEGLMRETVSSPAFETQTLPSPTATSSGTEPTSIVARTSLVEGSILETDPRFALMSALTTQSDPSPEAMPIGIRADLDRRLDLRGLRAGGTRRCGRARGGARLALDPSPPPSLEHPASSTRAPASASAVRRGAPLSIVMRYVLRRSPRRARFLLGRKPQPRTPHRRLSLAR